MADLLIVIFTHDRPEMLQNLLSEVGDAIVLDKHPGWDGKRMFWYKWQKAVEVALNSGHQWILFLPDDVSNVNMKAIDLLTRQEWGKHLMAVNVLNDGRTQCWGYHRTGQKDFKIADIELKEVGFVDCGYLTNKYTLKRLKIEEPPVWWWDRPDKSSGVGWQTTNQFRSLGVKMMMPTPSLADHGAHSSVMHGEHRKETPLIANRSSKERKRTLTR